MKKYIKFIKKSLLLVLILFTLASCTVELPETNDDDITPDNGTVVPTIPVTPTVKPDVSKVNFAMINDTHGAFVDSSDGYAIAKVDTLLDRLTSINGDYIKIANGDILQGSYVSTKTYGRQMIESLNVMDFDAFVIGNHEFDWGLDKIAKYKDGDLTNGEADYPFLGANIYYKGTTLNPDWIDPYTIVDYYGVKVGIIGLIGGTQESDILATNISEYYFLDDPTNLVERYSLELRNEKECDVVVVSVHDYDEALNTRIAKLPVASRVDAIFCGHTHQFISTSVNRTDGNSIPVVQNYDKNETVQTVTLALDENYQMATYQTIDYEISGFEDSKDLTEIYNYYSALVDESTRVIGNTRSYLSRETIGGIAARAMYEYNYNINGISKVDLTILNTGGVRTAIKSGNITVGDVFNTFPFENMIYLVKLYGKEAKKLAEDSYYYTYSNVTFNDEEIYVVAVIDYVYFGPYTTSIFNKKIAEYSTGILMRDIFLEYVENNY